jgi:hypothetical protein
MILDTKHSGGPISSEGVTTTGSFSIARNAHMFSILSSGLYSRKIEAVLREIGCNAMDAHIMFGTPDRPIEVKLPTALDRSFFVKDHGPGLDKNELEKLYTTYGWSNKQQSAEAVGCFGLGSKAPFAYTASNLEDSDGFTVESVKDGMRLVYTCYIGSNGEPAISQLFEGPNEDPEYTHGLKVMLPVQTGDIREFQEKAASVYRWFKVPPVMLGADHELKPATFTLNGSFFGLQASDDPKPYVIMGGVRYPIDPASLRNLSPTSLMMLNAGINIWAAMGAVKMTPSREHLEYNELTRTNLQDMLQRAALEVARTLHDVVTQPQPSQWHLSRAIQTYKAQLPQAIVLGIAEFLCLAGLDAAEAKRIGTVLRQTAAPLPEWSGEGFASGGPRVFLYNAGETRRKEVFHGYVDFRSKKPLAAYISYLRDVEFFYADVPTADARVKELIETGKLQTAVLVTAPKSFSLDRVRDYATKLANDPQLLGIPLRAASVLDEAKSVLKARAIRKLNVKRTPREVYSSETARYVSLDGAARKTVTFGSLKDTELFYVIASRVDTHAEVWGNRYGEGLTYHVAEYYQGATLAHLDRVREAAKLPMTGFILVPSVAAVRKLKLADQGFKEFFPSFIDALKEPAVWSALTGRLNLAPRRDFGKVLKMENGVTLLEVMASHEVQHTEAWKKLAGNRKLVDLALRVIDVAARCNQPKGKKDLDLELMFSLTKLAGHVSGHGLCTEDYTQQTTADMTEQFAAEYPFIEAMNQHTLAGWFASDTDRALTALEFVCQASSVAVSVRAQPAELTL